MTPATMAAAVARLVAARAEQNLPARVEDTPTLDLLIEVIDRAGGAMANAAAASADAVGSPSPPVTPETL